MNKTVFDFLAEHRDPQVFLNCAPARELAQLSVDGEHVWCTSNMDKDDLREAIVSDVLGATMWEIQSGQKLCFDRQELVRLCATSDCDRILALLEDEAVKAFVEISVGQLRIRRECLQAAMDYCGVWYTGFEMPVTALRTNREEIEQQAQDHGGIDNLASALTMELLSEYTVPQTLQ